MKHRLSGAFFTPNPPNYPKKVQIASRNFI